MRSLRATCSAAGIALALAFAAPLAHAAAPDGAALFSANCAYCHGAKGQGDGPNAAKLKPRVPDLTRSKMAAAGIEKIVRDGKGECPSWKSSLSADEIRAVSAHAKSLQR